MPNAPLAPTPCRLAWLFVAALLALCHLSTSRSAVLINEIHYHPTDEPAYDAEGFPVLDLTDDLHEFIELVNVSSNAVPLAGWKLSGGIEFTFPSGLSLEPSSHLVVARNPDRLASIESYGLKRESIAGPWIGKLGNSRDSILLLDPTERVVDRVEYRSGFPWPTSANALGADEEWVGTRRADFLYRGRSLERVSTSHPSNDPANWIASPLHPGPSPGSPNSLSRPIPDPVVVALSVAQASDGHRIIRSNQIARIECAFSSTSGIRSAAVEWFIDNLTTPTRPSFTNRFLQLGTGRDARFAADLPGQTNRTLIRYRILADLGQGLPIISPRPDDAARWHAYFVTPQRLPGTNVIYDILISKESLRILKTNIASEPKRVVAPDPPGALRTSWNATQPAVFIHDGKVWDIQFRHHGSEYRREESRRSYKLRFPDYDRFLGQDSLFITDKDYRTETGHALTRAAGLPSSKTRWVDLYFNENPRLVRLEQEEQNQQLLERWESEQERLHGAIPGGGGSLFFKAMGVGNPAGEGPFGPGNGTLLPPRIHPATKKVFWTSLQRYEHTYGLQNQSWRGSTEFQSMIESMWKARPNLPTLRPTNGVAPASLRQWYAQNWHLDHGLTHLVLANWMGFWDDNTHNQFLWRHGDGRWSQLPWDFDGTLDEKPWAVSIFVPESGQIGNQFKLGLLTTHWDEFKLLAWQMNNTLLHPDALVAHGASPRILNWARPHFTNVNTLLKLGIYPQPPRPSPVFPSDGGRLAPLSPLRCSAFSHSTDPSATHQATLWEVRAADGDYSQPAFRTLSTNHLTELPVPTGVLRLGTPYRWRVTHFDAENHPSVVSPEFSFHYAGPADSAGSDGIVLNEVLADNRNAVLNRGSASDYIELANFTGREIRLDGFGLTDSLDQPFQFTFPPGTRLAAKSYLVVWCDKLTDLPGFHSGFKLDAEGETIALFAPGESNPRLVDILQFGIQLPNLSIGRIALEPSDWVLGTPSPLAPNSRQNLGSQSSLRINEWSASPLAGDDWIELHNLDPLPVALHGLSITDDSSNPIRSPFARLSFIGGRNFRTLRTSAKSEPAADRMNFGLASSGSIIALYCADGTRVDAVMYGHQAPGEVLFRLPDGGSFVHSLIGTGTPGSSNVRDSTADGLPDPWQEHFGLLGISPDVDSDQDGLTNREEYAAGTDPRDPTSGLTLSLEPGESPGMLRIRFVPLPTRSYRLEYRPLDPQEPWHAVEQFPGSASPESIQRDYPIRDEGGFLRLAILP